MTVRRRLLGPSAAFAAALFLVGTAGAQFPRPAPVQIEPGFGANGAGRPLTQGEVKARIEAFLNGDPRGLPPPQLPFGLSPEQLANFGKMLTGADKNKKLNPDQEAALKQWAEKNPELFNRLKATAQKGQTGKFDPNAGKGVGPFGKETRPDPGPFDPENPPVRPPFKTENPPPFKLDPPVKRPPPDQPPMPPMPVPPDGKALPPRPDLPPPLGLDRKELAPWETPESPQEKARQAAAAMWEKNVGPLDETPAVKQALFDLADGSGDLRDPDGNNLWESLSKELGDGKGLGDLLNGVDAGDGFKFGDNWDFPKLDWNFPNLNWGNTRTPQLDGGGGTPRESWWSRWRRSSSPSTPSASQPWFSGWGAPKWNIGIPALDGTWLPVVFVVAALVAGFFLWRYVSRRLKVPDHRIDPYALGPWPVDPHHLASRQDVVVAFEHLSVLICGPVAKTWTHTTIAGALSELALAEPRRALLLARLYELARYTPADEPLTTVELAEARRIVCQLAGFGDD